jgi:hypothetical protein
MVGALRQNAPILSVASFRTWLASRPDEEHWELIEGVPMMTTPPNRLHQRIASNLESLLNAALKRHNPMLVAYHDIGVNIVSTVPYDPEPDVAVIREDENPDRATPIAFIWLPRFCPRATRASPKASGISTERMHPALAFCWYVRIAWKSLWTVEPPMAGAPRCCMQPTNSPCRSSALPVWSGTFTAIRPSAEPACARRCAWPG